MGITLRIQVETIMYFVSAYVLPTEFLSHNVCLSKTPCSIISWLILISDFRKKIVKEKVQHHRRVSGGTVRIFQQIRNDPREVRPVI